MLHIYTYLLSCYFNALHLDKNNNPWLTTPESGFATPTPRNHDVVPWFSADPTGYAPRIREGQGPNMLGSVGVEFFSLRIECVYDYIV